MNSLDHAATMLSCNAVLGVISESHAECLPQFKSLIRVDNRTSDSWTRNITKSSLTDKSLDRIFFSLLIN